MHLWTPNGDVIGEGREDRIIHFGDAAGRLATQPAMGRIVEPTQPVGALAFRVFDSDPRYHSAPFFFSEPVDFGLTSQAMRFSFLLLVLERVSYYPIRLFPS